MEETGGGRERKESECKVNKEERKRKKGKENEWKGMEERGGKRMEKERK